MNTPSLAGLQHALQQFLLDPGTDPGSIVVGTARIPREVRLAIYANGYRSRCVEALTTDFAGVHAYLGDEAFATLIHAYLAVHPSRFFSLRWLGQSLPGFLQLTPPYSEHPELHELALFEWALCNAFDAADAEVIGVPQLAQLTGEEWPRLRLAFHPSLQHVDLSTNAPAIWSALNAEQAPPPPELTDTAARWNVWRQDLTLLFRSLTTEETACLECFQHGATFSEVCLRLCELMDATAVPAFAAGKIRQWLDEGLIVGAVTADD